MMRQVYTILIMCSLTITCWAQTQQGVVKTKGRMVNGKHVAGQGLSGATVTIQGRNAVQSQTNGGFSFPIPNKTFMLQGVQKNGYQLVDPDATRKAYQYSPNTFYIVMETPDQQQSDKLAAERKIRRTLQRQLQQCEDELEELKAQNKLTQEEYRKALQKLYDEQQNNEKLIADMAKEYAEMDYDQMDELNRQISDAILNGELTKADSILRLKGDMNRRDAEITHRLEAETKRKEEIEQQQVELAASKEGTRKLLEDFAEDCYKYHNIFLLENKYDSAAYYIELRANRDTTNADWQYDAAYYFKKQRQYLKAQTYYGRTLLLYQRLVADNQELYEYEVAATQNSLAILYSDLQKYTEAERMYLSALESYQHLAASNHIISESDTIAIKHNLAILYIETKRFTEAEKMCNSVLKTRQRLVDSYPETETIEFESDLADTQEILALLYMNTDRYEEAEQLCLSVLDIYQRIASSNPKLFEFKLAIAKNSLAILYRKTHRYAEAEKMCLSALEIRQRLAVSNPEAYEPSVLSSLNCLANLYSDTQRYTEAGKVLLSVLEISQHLATFAPDLYEPDIATTQHSIADLYFQTRQYVEAEKMYLSVIETYQHLATFNSDTYKPYVAQTKGSLSFIKILLKKYTEAEQYAREGLGLDPTKHFICTNLAAALLFQGKYAEAEQIYRQYKDELKEGFLDDFKQYAEAGVIPKENEADVEKIKKMLNE